MSPETPLALWSGLEPEVRGAIVGAAATTLAALVGFLAVVVQIGRQARLAIEQQRRSEAAKLKLSLYERIVATCEAVIDAEVEFSSYIRNFVAQLHGAINASRSGQFVSTPNSRVPELIRLQEASHLRAVEIVTTVEQWRIVDPRMVVFQVALNAALHDMRTAYVEFFSRFMSTFPMDGPQPGTTFPWQVPNDATLSAVEASAEKMYEANGLLGCFVADFRDAMQAALLGDLFPNPITPRKPLDPRYIVVTLDRHEELIRYFESETSWGRDSQAAEARAREALLRQ